MSDLISRKALMKAFDSVGATGMPLNVSKNYIQAVITNAPAVSGEAVGIRYKTPFGYGFRDDANIEEYPQLLKAESVYISPQQTQEQGELVRKAVADALEEAASIKVAYKTSGRDDVMTNIVEGVIQGAVSDAIAQYKDAIRALIKRNAVKEGE